MNSRIIRIIFFMAMLTTKVIHAQFVKGQKFVQAHLSLSYEKTNLGFPLQYSKANLAYYHDNSILYRDLYLYLTYGQMISNRTLRNAYLGLGVSESSAGYVGKDTSRIRNYTSRNQNTNCFVSFGVQYVWYFPIGKKFGGYIFESNLLLLNQNQHNFVYDSLLVLSSQTNIEKEYSLSMNVSLGLGLYYWVGKNWLIQTSISPLTIGYIFQVNQNYSVFRSPSGYGESETRSQFNQLVINSSLSGVNLSGIIVGVVYKLR